MSHCYEAEEVSQYVYWLTVMALKWAMNGAKVTNRSKSRKKAFRKAPLIFPVQRKIYLAC
jgi:hypothetical protein